MWGVISASYQSRAPLKKVMTSRSCGECFLSHGLLTSPLLSARAVALLLPSASILSTLSSLFTIITDRCVYSLNELVERNWWALLHEFEWFRVLPRRVCVFDLETVSMSLRPLVAMIHRLERIEEGILWILKEQNASYTKVSKLLT